MALLWSDRPENIPVPNTTFSAPDAGIFMMVPGDRVWRRGFGPLRGFYWYRDDWVHPHFIDRCYVSRLGKINRFTEYCGP